MEVLILIIVIALPILAALYWAVARHQLVKYIALNHPSLWVQLRASDAVGEVYGFPPELARWIATKKYIEVGDTQLSSLAAKYQSSKFLGILGLFIGILALGVLSSAGS
jgi:hypothetical protein